MPKAITDPKSTTMKLSDAELAMMSAAGQREDRCLAPRKGLKGAVLHKASKKLIEAGLVREVRAKPGMPVWRHDDETTQPYSMKLTALGMRTTAADEVSGEGESEKSEIPALDAEVKKPASLTVDSPAIADAPILETTAARSLGSGSTANVDRDDVAVVSTPPRSGSKLAQVVELLSRTDGASIDELIGATDWLPHTTRAALTGLRKRGYAIERIRELRVTRYSLAARATEVLPAADLRTAGSELADRAADATPVSSRKAPVGKRAGDRRTRLGVG